MGFHSVVPWAISQRWNLGGIGGGGGGNFFFLFFSEIQPNSPLPDRLSARPSVMLTPPKPLDEIQSNLVYELLT